MNERVQQPTNTVHVHHSHMNPGHATAYAVLGTSHTTQQPLGKSGCIETDGTISGS
jgi:hypothetical protein